MTNILLRLLLSLFLASFVGFFWWMAHSSFYLGPPPYPVLAPVLLAITMGSGELLILYLIWSYPK